MPRMSVEAQRDQIVSQVPPDGISHAELVRRLEAEGHASLVSEITSLVQRGELVAEVVTTGPATPAELRYSRPQA